MKVYNHLVFLGYIGGTMASVVGLLLAVFLLVKGDSKRTAFYRATRLFVLNVIAVVSLYFLFFYRETVTDSYEIGVVFRIIDYIICITLPYTWARLLAAMTDEEKKSHMRGMAAVMILRLVVYIPVTIFFMDGYYFVANTALRQWLPAVNCLFSVLVCVILISLLLFCLRDMLNAMHKKFAVLCSGGIVFFDINQSVVDMGFFAGKNGISGWQTGILDPTGLITFLLSFATIVMIYKTDFSPLFTAAEREEEVIDEMTVNFDLIAEKHKLTRREREIIELVYSGKTNPDIAEVLFISRNTVKLHIHHIFEKLDVSTRVELVHIVNSKTTKNSTFG